MNVDIRPITEDEIAGFRTAINRAFGGDADNDDESIQRFKDQVDLTRAFGAFDGADLVGTAATFSFELTLPGGLSTPMGGLTMVSVSPTHRRRGLLNRLMDSHFRDCMERGEAVAGLWASESAIYGRYGYGDACPNYTVEFDGRKVGIPPGPDETRILDKDSAEKVMKEVYAEVYTSRPGMLARSDVWWQHRHLRDPQEWRSGASERRYVGAFRDGRPVGYTTYRQKSKWENGIPDGTIVVGEVMGIDPDARLSLWSLVGSIDLYPNVEAWDQPSDFELPYQVSNPRAIKKLRGDGQYIRVLDVAAALSGRGYQDEGALAIAVEDPLGFTGGTYRLEVADGEGSVTEVSETPDVVMNITTLGSLYLGAPGAETMARAGLIEGSVENVRRLAALLRHDPAPWCPEVY